MSNPTKKLNKIGNYQTVSKTKGITFTTKEDLMNLIEKALQIALDAHAGQTDKAGKPYILHPLRMMLQMKTDEERAAALLHDVIEESALRVQDLLEAGIPGPVVDAVQMLTRSTHETYGAFIERILTNELAVKIKAADIEDNLNLLRRDALDHTDFLRILKYHNAWHQLNGKQDGQHC